MYTEKKVCFILYKIIYEFKVPFVFDIQQGITCTSNTQWIEQI